MSRRGSREMRSLTWGEAGGACQSVGVVGVVGRSLRFASPRDSYLRGALRGAASRLHPRHTGLRAHPFLFPPPPRVITETGYRRGTCGEVLLTLSPSKSWHIQKHRRNPSRRPITLVRGDGGEHLRACRGQTATAPTTPVERTVERFGSEALEAFEIFRSQDFLKATVSTF